jgi:hypothetical protein
LLAGSGRTLEQLSAASETAKERRRCRLKGRRSSSAPQSNAICARSHVLALVEGSDPKLRDETVIVCAHFDHDGRRRSNPQRR